MAKSDVEIYIKSPGLGSLVVRSDSRVILAQNVVPGDFVRLRVSRRFDFSIEFRSKIFQDDVY